MGYPITGVMAAGGSGVEVGTWVLVGRGLGMGVWVAVNRGRRVLVGVGVMRDVREPVREQPNRTRASRVARAMTARARVLINKACLQDLRWSLPGGSGVRVWARGVVGVRAERAF